MKARERGWIGSAPQRDPAPDDAVEADADDGQGIQ